MGSPEFGISRFSFKQKFWAKSTCFWIHFARMKSLIYSFLTSKFVTRLLKLPAFSSGNTSVAT